MKHKTKIKTLTPLDNVLQVKIFIARLINGVMTGEVEPGTATKVGYLAGVLLKAIELSDLENRLNQLERVAEEMEQQREGMLEC